MTQSIDTRALTLGIGIAAQLPDEPDDPLAFGFADGSLAEIGQQFRAVGADVRSLQQLFILGTRRGGRRAEREHDDRRGSECSPKPSHTESWVELDIPILPGGGGAKIGSLRKSFGWRRASAEIMMET